MNNEDEIYRLEKIIQQKDNHINQLTKQINEYREKNIQENQRQKPTSNQSQQKELNISIQLLENKVGGLSFQNLILQNQLNERGAFICQLQQKLLETQRMLEIKQDQIQLMKIQMIYGFRKGRNSNSSFVYEKQIDHLMRQRQSILQEKFEIIKENMKLKQNLNDQRKKIKQIIQQHIQFQEQITTQFQQHQKHSQDQKISSNQKSNQQFCQLRQTINLLKEQLVQKNNEIISLYQNKANNKDIYNQHTIFHLRDQLNKKSNLVRESLLKLKRANDLIQQFTKKKEEFDSLSKINQELKLKIQQNKKRETNLLLQNSQLKKKLQKCDKIYDLYQKNMSEIILQNEKYHRKMFQEQGNNSYRKTIQDDVEELKKNMNDRYRNNQWASIGQLIQMNRKLMEMIC